MARSVNAALMKSCWRMPERTRGSIISSSRKSSHRCLRDPCKMSDPVLKPSPLESPVPKSASLKCLKSMTGYAQARVEKDGWAVQLSLRSVNHRFLDLRIRMPEGWDALETEIRHVAREHVRRGHLDVTLHVEAANSHSVSINREVAAEYLKAAKSLGEQFGVRR